LEGITVTGTVPDVRPYYQNAVAAIIPIRTGSGTRLKILEALAAGVPVISSPLGAEGLAVTPGKNILMADPADPGQWIQHLTALANTPSLARQLADEGRALVRERYDWETLGQKLVDTYRGWL
jgi:glycosyltransferase involved in cell wall biosynthesis